MITIGLTGSIGMGKSTTAAMFADLGAHVFDADAAVHALMARGGGAVPEIAKHFPEAVIAGSVDRKTLGAAVFGNPPALNLLESILHPRVRFAETRFRQHAMRGRMGGHSRTSPLVLLFDIPLLFETGVHRLPPRHPRQLDAIVVASAPTHIQRQRVLARSGMTSDRLDAILKKQMPDHVGSQATFFRV
ncbi:MAG: dephospho-CoA kinase, partial [Pseudomonadota bacterium]